MTMRTVAIVLETADQAVPAGLLEKVLEQSPNAFSFSVTEADKKQVKFHGSTEEIPTAEQWANIRSGQLFKPIKIVTWWGNDKNIMEDDIQPFVLRTDEKDRPLIVAYVDAQLGSKQTAKGFVTQVLSDLVEPYVMMAEGDIPKLMKALCSDAFRRQVLQKLPEGAAGTIILHSTEGIVCITNDHNDADADGDWGYCSQAYGWSMPAAAPKSEPAKQVKSSFLDNLAAQASGAASAVTSMVGHTSKEKLKNSTANTQELAELAKAALVGGGGSTTKVEMIFPPQELISAAKLAKGDSKEDKAVRRKLADWYRDRSPKQDFSLDRDLPGWREGCGIPAAGSWKTKESFVGAFKRFNQSDTSTKDTGTHNLQSAGPDVAAVDKKIREAAETRNNIFNTFRDQERVQKIVKNPPKDPVTFLAGLRRPSESPLKSINMPDWLAFLSLERDDLRLLSDQTDWMWDCIEELGHHYATVLVDNLKLRAEKPAESSSVIIPDAADKEAVATGAPVPRQRKRMF